MSLLDSVSYSREEFVRMIHTGMRNDFPFKNRKPTLAQFTHSWEFVYSMLSQVYDGTFIDVKFTDDWLEYHGLSRTMLAHCAGNAEAIEKLFWDCIAYVVRTRAFTTDVADWVYNATTGRSGFLIACAHTSNAAYELLLGRGIPQSLLDRLRRESGSPLLLSLSKLVNWYDQNRDALFYIHYGSWWFTPFTSVGKFVVAYVEFLLKHDTEIQPYFFSPGNRYWFDFALYAHSRWGINLQWTQQQYETAKANITLMEERKTKNPKPALYGIWPLEKRFKWDLENDLMFTHKLSHTDPELIQKWEEFKHNWDEMKLWLKERNNDS